jgi:hypothetical protein
MVCPKLSDGECEKLKLVCPQTYDLKMINHEKCKVFRESGGVLKAVKTSKTNGSKAAVTSKRAKASIKKAAKKTSRKIVKKR